MQGIPGGGSDQSDSGRVEARKVLRSTSISLRPREAARALGVSERTLWTWTAGGSTGIPHVRIGGVLLYPVRELEEWLADQSGQGVNHGG